MLVPNASFGGNADGWLPAAGEPDRSKVPVTAISVKKTLAATYLVDEACVEGFCSAKIDLATPNRRSSLRPEKYVKLWKHIQAYHQILLENLWGGDVPGVT